jgi:hypothetical protein
MVFPVPMIQTTESVSYDPDASLEFNTWRWQRQISTRKPSGNSSQRLP